MIEIELIPPIEGVKTTWAANIYLGGLHPSFYWQTRRHATSDLAWAEAFDMGLQLIAHLEKQQQMGTKGRAK